MITTRLDKLRADSVRVEEENSKLIIKSKELDPLTQLLEIEVQKIKAKQN